MKKSIEKILAGSSWTGRECGQVRIAMLARGYEKIQRPGANLPDICDMGKLAFMVDTLTSLEREKYNVYASFVNGIALTAGYANGMAQQFYTGVGCLRLAVRETYRAERFGGVQTVKYLRKHTADVLEFRDMVDVVAVPGARWVMGYNTVLKCFGEVYDLSNKIINPLKVHLDLTDLDEYKTTRARLLDQVGEDERGWASVMFREIDLTKYVLSLEQEARALDMMRTINPKDAAVLYGRGLAGCVNGLIDGLGADGKGDDDGE